MSERRRQWRSLFSGTVPKDSAFPDSNEDRLCAWDDRRLYVISDGASESFNSALWAEVLVGLTSSGFPSSGFTRWLRTAIAIYEGRSGIKNFTWSQEAAFARGSYASLLAVALSDDCIQVTAIGDSVALLVEDGKIVRSFPYMDSRQFQERPHLLSTIRSRHSVPFFRQGLRSLVSKDASSQEEGWRAFWQYPDSGDSYLICVTDALGEWLLRRDSRSEDRVNAVLSIKTQQDLIFLIETARSEDGMRRDDSTVIVVGEADGTSHP